MDAGPDELVDLAKHQKLIGWFVRKYRWLGIEYEDLEQEVWMAAVVARNTYDPRLGEFSTWAFKVVSRNLLKAARRYGGPLHVSPYMRKRIRNGASLDDPTISKLERRALLHTLQAMGSHRIDPEILQRTVSGRPEPGIPDLDDIRPAIATLPERTRHVLEMRYGLNGGEPMTTAEIAAVYKISRQRIDQILAGAIAAIRAQLKD